MESTVLHLAVMWSVACINVCIATNGTSGTSLFASMPTQILYQSSVLPSGTQTTLYPSQTPMVYPTPTPSMTMLSHPTTVLHTPTPLPTQSASLTTEVSSGVDLQPTHVMNSSQSSSAPFPPPPIPPPFPTPILNITEDVSPTSTPSVPRPTQSMPAGVSSVVYDVVTSTVYEMATTYATPSGISNVVPASSARPDMTYRPTASQSFIMSTSAPTPSSSFTPPLSSALPTLGTTPSQVNPTESITSPPPLFPVKLMMILNGDCNHAKDKELLFREAFNKFIAVLLQIDVDRVSIQEIRCGSVVVDFSVEETAEETLGDKLTKMVQGSQLEFQFDNQNFTVYSAVVINIPNQTEKPLKTRKSGLTFEEEQLLIYIVIGSAMGIVILLSLILLVHHRIRKSCSTHAQSFDIQEEPHIKLSEFNMAHTYIPRPRSIYGSRLNTGAEGTYHTSNGNGASNHTGMQNPTPYVYADDEAIRDHYHEVVDDRAPAVQTTRLSQDFGRSAVPEMNLPRLEGVYRAGQDEDITINDNFLRPSLSRRGSDSSTVTRLSATFHAPPECPPTPPLPSPPLLPSPPPSPPLDPPTLDLPPPPPLPPPTPTLFHDGKPLAARLSGISNGSSSEATNSLPGDASFLLYKGCDYDPQPQGIDNPSYETSNPGDHEVTTEPGQRIPSFYSMSPPAPI